MTGLERLKEIAKSTNDFIISRCIALEIEIAGICDQIEREHLREVDDISGRDADILAWVEEHGGISELKSRLRSGEGAKESTSAYDLLPDCDREAISLALDCGGAEEIKKRVMPEGMEWPRFETSEPVKLGDSVEDEDGDEAEVAYITFHEDHVELGLFNGAETYPVPIDHGERVKRPAPDVLDADGVEIREGDTVYYVDRREQRVNTVARLTDDGCVQFGTINEAGYVTYCEAACIQPNLLTHRAPVLAADGKPLREGETVWYTPKNLGYPIECRVEKVNGDGSCELIDVVIPTNRPTVNPGKLTHECPAPPDSWELLESDADKNPFDYCKDVGHRLDTCENSEAYKARDLMRRAKKLAGVS